MSSNKLTCDEMRVLIGDFLQKGGHEAQRLWDILTCLRGPDSPSEVSGGSDVENSENYSLRRKRKYDTVEVIREKAFFGVVGGCARHHDDDHVIIPQNHQDHFDRHVQKAANALGLKVMFHPETSSEAKPKGCKVGWNTKMSPADSPGVGIKGGSTGSSTGFELVKSWTDYPPKDKEAEEQVSLFLHKHKHPSWDDHIIGVWVPSVKAWWIAQYTGDALWAWAPAKWDKAFTLHGAAIDLLHDDCSKPVFLPMAYKGFICSAKSALPYTKTEPSETNPTEKLEEGEELPW